MLDRMDRIETEAAARRIHFSFPQPPRTGRLVGRLIGVHKAYGDNVVYAGMDFQVERGDRVALVGVNGAGKSTLLKMLAGALEFDRGERLLGSHVEVQYYAQHQLDALDPSRTVLEELEHAAPEAQVSRLRTILGQLPLQRGRGGQEGGGAVRRREGAPGPGQDARAPGRAALHGRAHQPPGPRVQGGAGGSALRTSPAPSSSSPTTATSSIASRPRSSRSPAASSPRTSAPTTTTSTPRPPGPPHPRPPNGRPRRTVRSHPNDRPRRNGQRRRNGRLRRNGRPRRTETPRIARVSAIHESPRTGGVRGPFLGPRIRRA